ncbi:hypothetical protein [Asticcacaulis sp.]|uniref:hypothetical protein n=1 Tax=Asticcacaulis sp. TaxID=1872648 RepID=UPI003F7CB8D1
MKKLWLVVVGAMLFVCLPAYAAKPGAEKQPTKVEVVGEVKIAEPLGKPDPVVVPCPPDKDIRTSDLCAQWKAADAASRAANAADVANEKIFHANVVAGLSAVFSSLAMAGALASAWYARRTLASDRAWMTRTELTISNKTGFEEGHWPYIMVMHTWKNTGRSPALECCTFRDEKICLPTDELPKFQADFSREHPTAVGFDCKINSHAFTISNSLLEEVMTGKKVIYAYGCVRYKHIHSNKFVETETCLKVTFDRSPNGVSFSMMAEPVGAQQNAR